VILTRRSFFVGAAAMVAAPAIVRFESLMPVRGERFRYFPWGVVSGDRVVVLYDQLGNGPDIVASANGFYLKYPEGGGGGLWKGPTPLHFWGTRLL
jgi:hypothetical protein